MKKLWLGIGLFIGASLALFNFVQASTVLPAPQGGTGISSTPIGNVGNCLKVNSVNPLVYTLSTCGSGGGGGGGVNTSTINYFAYYLNATSITGTPYVQFNASSLVISTNTLFTTINASSTTSTNLYISNLANIAGLTFGTANGTSLTSTNAFFTSVSSTNATTTNLAIVGTLSCNAANQAIQTGADGHTSCGTLSTGAPFTTTSINGAVSTTFHFTTSSDTNIGLAITTTTDGVVFNPYWVGTLADNRITSAATWNAKLGPGYPSEATSTFVPYTGATKDVDLGIHGITSTLVTTSKLYASGAVNFGSTVSGLFWNSSSATLAIGSNDNTHNINGVTYYEGFALHGDDLNNIIGAAIHRHTNILAAGPFLTFGVSNGSEANPTSTANGHSAGGIAWTGYVSTTNQIGAKIEATTNGTITSSSMPMALHIYTTPNLSTNTLERITVLPNGNVGIASTTPMAVEGVQGVLGQELFDITSATGSPIYHISQSGNNGFGSSSPNAFVTIVDPLAAPGGDSTSTTGMTVKIIGAQGKFPLMVYSPGLDASTPSLIRFEDGTGNKARIAVTAANVVGFNAAAGNALNFGANGAATIDFVIINNHYVGVGSTTPLSSLSVQAQQGNENIVDFASSSGATALRILPTGLVGINTNTPLSLLGVQGISSTNYMQVVSTTGGTVFVVTADDKVGVGLANPAVNFQLHNPNSTSATLELTDSGTGATANDGLLFQESSGAGGGFLWNRENGYLSFGTNNAEKVRILAGGQVDISTTSLLALLNIQGTGINPFRISTNTAAGSSMIQLLTNGNLGVNTDTPIDTLAVQGGLQVVGGITSTNVGVNGIIVDSNGSSGSDGQVLSRNAGKLAWVNSSTGAGTVNAGTVGQVTYYDTSAAKVSGTSTLFFLPSKLVGINSTSPIDTLGVQGGLQVVGGITTTNFGITNFFTDTNGLPGNNGQVLSIVGGKPVWVTTSSGSGSGTVSSGLVGQNAFYAVNGAVISGTSTLIVSTTRRVGINSSSPLGEVAIQGINADPLFIASSSGSAMFKFKTDGSVVFGKTETTLGAFVTNPGAANPYFGIYDTGNSLVYGFAAALPAPAGTSVVGGYYAGLGIGGSSNGTTNPIFGVLNNAESGQGIGNTAFTINDADKVVTKHNVLDDGSGKFGIGSSTPAYNFVSTGTAAFANLPSDAAVDNTVCWKPDGQLQQQANCTVSSARFKEQILSLSPEKLMEEVRQLRAVSFDFKTTVTNGMNGNDKASTGFIAEEVAQIDPTLVSYTSNYKPEDLKFVLDNYGEKATLKRNGKVLIPQTVDYARVSVVLTGALQYQDEQRIKDEARLSKLEARTYTYGWWDWIIKSLKSLFTKK